MIGLNDVRRVRLRGGAANHVILDPSARPLVTGCGTPVKLTGPDGERYDRVLAPTATITCTACQFVTGQKWHGDGGDR